MWAKRSRRIAAPKFAARDFQVPLVLMSKPQTQYYWQPFNQLSQALPLEGLRGQSPQDLKFANQTLLECQVVV